MPAMNVSLTPELEAFVQEQVKSGAYVSASEVVRDALRMLAREEEMRQLELGRLRKAVQEGLDSIERGEVFGGEDVMAEIHRELAERAAIGQEERKRA